MRPLYSAMIYNLIEAAKANNLNTHHYFELPFTEVPKCHASNYSSYLLYSYRRFLSAVPIPYLLQRAV